MGSGVVSRRSAGGDAGTVCPAIPDEEGTNGASCVMGEFLLLEGSENEPMLGLDLCPPAPDPV